MERRRENKRMKCISLVLLFWVVIDITKSTVSFISWSIKSSEIESKTTQRFCFISVMMALFIDPKFLSRLINFHLPAFS